MQPITSEAETLPSATPIPSASAERATTAQDQGPPVRVEPEIVPIKNAPNSTGKNLQEQLPDAKSKAEGSPSPPSPPLLDKTLAALSNASEATLIASLSGVALLLSLILGKIGLLIVGITIGAVLHAALQTKNGLPDILKPKAETVDGEEVKTKSFSEDHDIDFSALPPKIANALGELLNAIVKDYINYWYLPLVPDDSSFPATCHQHLTATFVRFSKHISAKRPADVFLMTAFTMSNTMIVFMRELSQALSGTRDIKSGMRSYLGSNPNSALALMLHRGQQNRKLGVLAHEIINNYAPRDLKSCEPVALFLRHILRSVILLGTVERFSDPEFLNEWVVYLFEEKEDVGAGKEGVGAVLQAFDRSVAGAAQGTLPKVDTASAPPPKSVNQSPINRKENQRPASLQANGAHQVLSDVPETLPIDARFGGNERRDSIEFLPASKNQSPVGSPSRSPIGDPLNRTSSNSSSRASIADLAMTPHKTSSESSHSGNQPPQAPDEPKAPVISLLNARVSVVDGGPMTNQAKLLKSKPNYQFMIQVEPLSAAGWIVMRRYQEFEVLHDTLRKIAAVTGSEKYMMAYAEGLPTWRERYADELVALLELYLRIVLSEERLVDTDALFRFFEKDEGKREREKQTQSELNSPWRSSTSLENVGKNVLGVFTKAPQSATEGSKALFGGLKKALTSQSPSEKDGEATFRSPFGFITPNSASRNTSRNRRSVTEDAYVHEKAGGVTNVLQESRMSGSPVEGPGENRGRRSMHFQSPSQSDDSKPALPPRRESSLAAPRRESSLAAPRSSTPHGFTDPMSQSTPALPPRGSIPNVTEEEATYLEASGAPDVDAMSLPPPPSEIDGLSDVEISEYKPVVNTKKVHEDITEQETQYVLEVMFSIINELYSLSSAWMIRRSLLNIAKSVMLRPGNATLMSMRTMIQKDVLDANTTHDQVADYIRQLRKNGVPTAAELEEWEKTRKIRSTMEKEELRYKARELLAESLPQGLTALLGVNQTKEAIYQLFDALQERDIARGFWTAILAETMQVVCQ